MPPPPQSMHRVWVPEPDMRQTYPQVTVATLQPAASAPYRATTALLAPRSPVPPPPTPRPGASATNYTLVAQKPPKSQQIPATSVQLAEMPAAPAHSPSSPPAPGPPQVSKATQTATRYDLRGTEAPRWGRTQVIAGCQAVSSRWVVVCSLLRLVPTLPGVIRERVAPYGAGLVRIPV